MISSLSNEKVKAWMKLYLKKYRNEEFLILDEKLCLKARENGFLKTLIYFGDKPFEFDDSFEVSQEVMEKLTKGLNLKWMGIGQKHDLDIKDIPSRILILDDLQDPLNIGKIIHTAYLFGFELILASKNTADIYNEKSINLSKGAIFDIPFKYVDLNKAINELKKNDYVVYATGLHLNNYELNEIKKENRMAFVLGNEGSGVSKEIMDISDGIIKIDMCNIDSLNVAMAGAILMYKFQKESLWSDSFYIS